MNCTSCGGESSVIDSRAKPGNIIVRRRKCTICTHRWTTYESAEKPENMHVRLRKDLTELVFQEGVVSVRAFIAKSLDDLQLRLRKMLEGLDV